MKQSSIKRLIQKGKATADTDTTQPQTRQVVAASGKLRVKVEGKSNGKTNN